MEHQEPWISNSGRDERMLDLYRVETAMKHGSSNARVRKMGKDLR